MPAPPTFLFLALALLAGACAGPQGRGAGAAAPAPETRMVVLAHAEPQSVASQLRFAAPAGSVIEALELPGVRAILLKGSPPDVAALERSARSLDHP